MIILDENIPESQLWLLRSWHVTCHQIGLHEGRKGTKDDGILALLHRRRQATFLTRDDGFYESKLCHRGYCIVVMNVSPEEVAVFARRVLNRPEFATKAARMGAVIRVSHSGLRVWHQGSAHELQIAW